MHFKAAAPFVPCLIGTAFAAVGAFTEAPSRRRTTQHVNAAAAAAAMMRPSFQTSARVGIKRSKLTHNYYDEAQYVIPPSSLSLSTGDYSESDNTRGEQVTDAVPLPSQVASTSSPASNSSGQTQDLTASMIHHHTAIKTSNISMSIAFYSLLDFYPVARFRTGRCRAAWLEHCSDWDEEREECRSDIDGTGGGSAGGTCRSRVELIEVPEDMLYGPPPGGGEGEGIDSRKAPRKRAVDRISNPTLLGWDHICLDVTIPIREMTERDDNGETEPNHDENAGSTETSRIKDGLQRWIVALNNRSQIKFGKNVRVALNPRVKLFGRERCEYAFIYDADGGLIELVNRLGTVGEDEDGSTWDDEDDSRIVWRNG